MDFVFSFFIFLLYSFLFMFTLSIIRKPKINLPPGPKKLPIIGNLHLLAGPNPAHHTLRDLARKHGPLMHLQLGEVGVVVVSSPETAKEVLKTHDINFATRPQLLAPEINCYGNTDIAFAPYGEYWRQLRKICRLELLTNKRVQSFRPIREEEVLDFCKWIAQHEGTTVNLTEKLSIANINVMVRAAFGMKTGDVATLVGIIREAQEFLTAFNLVDVYPSVRILRLLSGLRWKIEKHHRLLDRITEDIVQERIRIRATKGDDFGGEHDHDLLDVLLNLQSDGSLEIPLTTNNIKSVLLDGAGVESSTTTVNWAMAEMLKKPTVFKKAQYEVRSIFDGKNHVDERLFDELKYLKLVIKETLRLHPPGPLLLPRESREPCKIDGYDIPAKTWVLVNAFAVGRDPVHWEDAESFQPERFLEKSIDFNATRFDYIPFGGGRRICPGISFGIANVEIELAMLLYHFDWDLPHGMKPEDVNMTEVPGMAARRKDDLCVIPRVRRPLPGLENFSV